MTTRCDGPPRDGLARGERWAGCDGLKRESTIRRPRPVAWTGRRRRYLPRGTKRCFVSTGTSPGRLTPRACRPSLRDVEAHHPSDMTAALVPVELRRDADTTRSDARLEW